MPKRTDTAGIKELSECIKELSLAISSLRSDIAILNEDISKLSVNMMDQFIQKARESAGVFSIKLLWYMLKITMICIVGLLLFGLKTAKVYFNKMIGIL